MRVLNTLKNSGATLAQMLVGTLFGFVVRTVFIKTLGADYQGLNNLFGSILGMLSIAELGIGTAIVYNMYPFIATHDTEQLKSLMRFYRTAYRWVAAAVAFFGLLLMPFLHFFNNYQGIHENVYVIYLLFLANSVASYFFSYKRSILYADQKNYVTSIFDLGYTFVINIAYLVILLVFQNFILYLAASLIFSFLENILISFYADRRYPWLTEKKAAKIAPEIFQNFRKQIYGMLYHNIGYFVVIGTDSMIITKFLGLAANGKYSNYIMVTAAVATIISAILNGSIASVGNLLTEKKSDQSFDAYKKISFATFWIFTFASVSCLLIMQPFIQIWLGKAYLLSFGVLLVVVLNFYVQGMRRPITIFQSASGIFYENRHVPLIEAAVNLVASVVLVNFFGLEGVLLGTLISTMILYSYSFPKYIYAPVFERKTSGYLLEQGRYFLIFLGILGLSVLTNFFVSQHLGNVWQSFFVSLIVSLIAPNLLLFLLFRKSDNFDYFTGLVKKMLPRRP